LLTHQLPPNATIADIGSGAGLPIIPCMIARPDLETTLIESSQKKSVFLREAINQLGLKRGTIICKPFEDTPAPEVAFVSSRALDDFLAKVRALVKWSPADATLLLFGGTSLREELEKLPCQFSESLIPQSTQRFIFVVKKH
jgi:16S rRNA (guanine527-N7)-methyltransferase